MLFFTFCPPLVLALSRHTRNPESATLFFVYRHCQVSMMTSSNRSSFRVTGPLCGEFTGHRSIPLTKTSDVELWCFLSSVLNKWLSKQSLGWWFETPSRSLWRHCNGCKLQRTNEQHRSDVARCCIFVTVRWPDASAINAILAEIQIRSIRYSIELLFSDLDRHQGALCCRQYSLWAAGRTCRRQVGTRSWHRRGRSLREPFANVRLLGPPISEIYNKETRGHDRPRTERQTLYAFPVLYHKPREIRRETKEGVEYRFTRHSNFLFIVF